MTRTLFILFFLFLALWAVLWMGHLPYYLDTILYVYPDRFENFRSFQQGFLPLWDPYLGCGTPHLANWQSACLYPFFWVFQWTGVYDWLMMVILFHCALAFTGAYLWLRSQKADPLWSVLGALSFALSGHLIRCWTNLPFLATAAWSPWVFWGFQRALASPRRWNWVLAGLFLALQVLAGYPFFSLYTVILLLVWFWYQKPGKLAWPPFALTLGVSAMLTSPQWLPFLDFLGYSHHDLWREYPYYEKPLEYLTLLKPDLLGMPGASNYQGSFANANFNLYIGLFPLGALLMNLFHFRWSRFFTVGAVFWLFWMAGRHFFLWYLLPQGFLEWIEPTKSAGMFVFCAVTSAAVGLSSLPPVKWAGKIRLLLLGGVALLWCLDLFLVPFLLLKPMRDPYRNPAIQENVASLKNLAGTGRFLSLHTSAELTFTGGDMLDRSYQAQVGLGLADANKVWGIRSADQYLYQRVEGSENLLKYFNKGFPYKGDLLSVAGVRLFLLPANLPSANYQPAGTWMNDIYTVNKKASPDMRWVPGAEQLPDRAFILNRLSQEKSGWEKTVLLESSGNTSLVPSKRRWFGPVALGRESDSRAAGLVSCPSTGYLVFNEIYCPGWKAWVDGNPASILRAYGLFMTVPIPTPGDHLVVFRYEPTAFRLGLFLPLAFFVMVFAGLGIKSKTLLTTDEHG